MDNVIEMPFEHQQESVDEILAKIDFSNPPIAYNWNTDTKEYVDSEQCTPDFLESAKEKKPVWLIPANSTFTIPPFSRSGYARVWNGENWTYEEDNRGKEYWLYDGNEPVSYTMKDLGPLPEGAYLTEPPIIYTKQELFQFLRQARDARLVQYDNAIAQIDREMRLATSDEAKKSLEQRRLVWDLYAQSLCALPEKPGAPWDGGGEKTPWPPVPYSEAK